MVLTPRFSSLVRHSYRSLRGGRGPIPPPYDPINSEVRRGRGPMPSQFDPENSNVRDLLRGAVTQTDTHMMDTDQWATSPYPGIRKQRDLLVEETDRPTEPILDGSNNTVLLFPGQGSQFVGMGKKLENCQKAMELYKRASSLLNYDLYKLCTEGPKKDLDKTIYCQPAIFVTSLAALEKLNETDPDVVTNCIGTAGFSVGEYAALVFAQALSFEIGLELIKVRAEAMQEVSERHPSGMMSVIVGASSQLSKATEMARKFTKEQTSFPGVCQVANYLFSQCKVIGGDEMALKFVEDNARHFGIIKTKRLPVSGAFHTKLMYQAAIKLSTYLEGVKINQPIISVMSNSDGKLFPKSEEGIKRHLVRQVHNAVKWEQLLSELYRDYCGQDAYTFPRTFEVGPGKQLKTILTKVNGKAAKNCYNIDV